MKKLIAILALGLSALGFAGTALAQDNAASAPAAAAATAAPAAAAAASGAEAAAPAAAAASAPVANKGDVAWMVVATMFVIMMSIPGLALFYGGLVRSKNMLSVLMQVFVTFSLIVVLWCVYGYSLAFTEGNSFVGGLDRLFMRGLFDPAKGEFAMAATFSKGVYIPGAAVHGVPGHVRGDHLLPDRRGVRRAHEVLGGAAVHGALVHLQLRADRPHGLVLDGPGRLHREGSRRRDQREGRPDLAVGRARLRRRHGRPHQRGGGRPGRRLHDRQARRLRQGGVHAALADADDGRCRTAVGRLVRLQRRLGARGRQLGGARLHQHLLGHRRGGAGVVHRRGDDQQGQGVDARRRVGRRCRPGGDHAGRAATSA